MFRKIIIASLSLMLGGWLLMTNQAAAQDGKVILPFNGKNLDGWKLKERDRRSYWTVGQASLDPEDASQLVVKDSSAPNEGEMINAKGAGEDIYTEQRFGNCIIELEVMVPKGSNSGIYVMGEYEIQVFDSYGKDKLTGGDMGAIYGAAPPKVNACKAPGQWQKYEIHFQAPQFEEGRKISNAKFLKVVLNGQVLHENVEMRGPTPSGVTGQEAPTGPLMFQGDHGPVAYRNIRITPR